MSQKSCLEPAAFLLPLKLHLNHKGNMLTLVLTSGPIFRASGTIVLILYLLLGLNLGEPRIAGQEPADQTFHYISFRQKPRITGLKTPILGIFFKNARKYLDL